MKVLIKQAACYQESDLIEQYPVLEKYGFKDNYIEINTLEELFQLSLDVGWEIVVGAKEKLAFGKERKENTLLIYDDYIE